MRRKLRIITYFVLFFSVFSCSSQATDDYDSIVVDSATYSFSDNWPELEKEGKVLLFYKTSDFNGETVITNFFYSLKTNENDFVYLGGFNAHKGFVNNERKEFMNRRAISSKSKFIKKDLVGISMKLLDDPFVVVGLVQNKEDKMLYETETLVYFFIDAEKKTIVDWAPNFW